MGEKLIFNLLAFTLFILMFIHFIRKNDTSYVYLLAIQFLGMLLNFIELWCSKSFWSNSKNIDVCLFDYITNMHYVFRTKKEFRIF